MFELRKTAVVTIVAASLMTVPAERTAADAGDVAAGIAGAIILCGITRCTERQRTTRSRGTAQRTARPGIPSTQEGRQLQSALNYFGYNAGAVDGQVGRGTRAAVSRFQSAMGFQADGYIDPHERDFLISSYNRALRGDVGPHGPILQQQGANGLLAAFNRDRLGHGTYPSGPIDGFGAGSGAGAARAGLTPSPGTVVTPQQQAPAVAETPAPTPRLPNFGQIVLSKSMAQHCSGVQAITTANGSHQTAATMTDADFALSELFCTGRAYAMASGQKLQQQVQGQTEEQVAASCEQLPGYLSEPIEALASEPLSTVVSKVDALIGGQMHPTQAAHTGEICLSVGYRQDKPDVALGSLLMLVSAERPAYGELVGHHLREGFGVTPSTQQANMWYASTIEAINAGAEPAVSPGQTRERIDLLQEAMVRGASQARIKTAPQPVSTSFELPTFATE